MNKTAFPVPAGCGEDIGMTLRDYFAAKAMQAMMPVWAKENAHWKTMAERAYDMAEEMLEAREK